MPGGVGWGVRGQIVVETREEAMAMRGTWTWGGSGGGEKGGVRVWA